MPHLIRSSSLACLALTLAGFAVPCCADDAPATAPVANEAAMTTPDALSRLVTVKTWAVVRVDFTRVDADMARDWLVEAIRTAPIDDPLKVKMASALARDSEEALVHIRDAVKAGMMEGMMVMANPVAGGDRDSHIVFRLRDGADLPQLLTTLDLPAQYITSEKVGPLTVLSFNFNGANNQPQFKDAQPTTRKEVLAALAAAGDAPAMILVTPPPGSLNAAKLAMPELPKEFGSIKTKALVDGVDSVVFTGELLKPEGASVATLTAKLDVICSDPKTFVDAVSTVRKSFGEALKEGKIDGIGQQQQKDILPLVESLPEMVALEGKAELAMDDTAARKVVAAGTPKLIEEFRGSASYETTKNQRVLLTALAKYAAAHNGTCPDTLAELAPDIAGGSDIKVLTHGVLDDRPLVYRRPVGGLLDPIRNDQTVIVLHEALDGHKDEDIIAIGLANGDSQSITLSSLKQGLTSGAFKMADGALRQAD
ncbi:MAG: hypothetical protein QM770_00885 [Tepidisphaeraceae bacterium]